MKKWIKKDSERKEKSPLENVLKAQNHDFKEYVHYLSSPKHLFWMNFFAGTARGLGFMVGTVVVLGIATFIISKILSRIPWIGETFQWIQWWMEQNVPNYSASAFF